jgi:hypothetical protein
MNLSILTLSNNVISYNNITNREDVHDADYNNYLNG